MPAEIKSKIPEQILPFSTIDSQNKKTRTGTDLNRELTAPLPGTLLGSWGTQLRQADRQFLGNCKVPQFLPLSKRNTFLYIESQFDFCKVLTKFTHCQASKKHSQAIRTFRCCFNNKFAKKDQGEIEKDSYLPSTVANQKAPTLLRKNSRHIRSDKALQEVVSIIDANGGEAISIVGRNGIFLLSSKHFHLKNIKPNKNNNIKNPLQAEEQLPLPAKPLRSFQPLPTLLSRARGDQDGCPLPHHVSNTDCLIAGVNISSQRQRSVPVPCLGPTAGGYIS